MANLSFTDVRSLVRKNLDEQDPNGSIMYQDENGSSAAYGDNASLDSIIEHDLPEAINAVHKAAPVWLLEGKDIDIGDIAFNGSTPIIAMESDGVLSFTLKEDTKYLRLVAFRAADSGIVVTDAIPEASPEGRKQLNQYIRGRKDRPRLVQLQGEHSGPSFKYYSIETASTDTSDPFSAIAEMVYVQEQFYSAPTDSGSTEVYPPYPISRRLRQNIVDYLTAMVMETYGFQNTQAYYQKALTFPSL